MLCRICTGHDIEIFLRLGQQPLANKYPTAEQIPTEEFHDLNVAFCNSCKTVQLDKVISRDKMFVDYYYLSSVNKGLVDHFTKMADEIAESQPKFVVDIGSNDGILLKPLMRLRIPCLGIEPSANVSKIANDNGLTTLNMFFNADAVDVVMNKFGKADVIVASSVFTHLEDPHTFIEDVKNLLTNDGEFIVEVEYIRNFINQTQFERFYFDRILYYSLTSLKTLFEIHNMRIVDASIVQPHGGSLRIVAVKETSKRAFASRYYDTLTEEDVLNIDTLKEFAYQSDVKTAEFKNRLKEYIDNNIKVAGYGAPARLATITNFAKINSNLIPFVVDDSPLKAGKFSPGMHIPIVTKEYLTEHKPDVLIVFAWEYITDIMKKTNNGYKYVIPIPLRDVS